MIQIPIYLRNDQVITLNGVKDADTGAYLNDAVLSASLLYPDLSPVAAFVDVVLAYVALSNGNYELSITVAMLLDAQGADLPPGGYFLEVKHAANPHFHVRMPALVDYRSQ